MILTWKRNAAGEYESNAKYWDAAAGEHKPTYKIVKQHGAFALYVKGNIYIIYSEYSKLLEREIACVLFTTLKFAKKKAQQLWDETPKQQPEIDAGFAAGGGWSGACWITGDGRGGAWHKDENGNRVEG